MTDIPTVGTRGRTILATAGAAIGSLTDGAIGGGANNGRAVEHLSNGLGLDQPMLRTAGMRGRLTHHGGRTRFGVRNVGGRIVLTPSPVELSYVRNLIFGSTGGLDDNGPIEFDAFVDRDSTQANQRYIYRGCKISRAEFRSAAGGMLTLTLDIVAKDEEISNTALPALPITSQSPMMHHDAGNSSGVLIDSGGAGQKLLKPSEIAFSVNHVLKDDDYYTSVTRVVIPTIDRIVDVSLVLPWTDDAIAYPLYPAPYSGFGATVPGRLDLSYVNVDVGTIGFALRFPLVKFSRRTPDQDGRAEGVYTLAGQAFAVDDSSREITNISITTS